MNCKKQLEIVIYIWRLLLAAGNCNIHLENETYILLGYTIDKFFLEVGIFWYLTVFYFRLCCELVMDEFAEVAKC